DVRVAHRRQRPALAVETRQRLRAGEVPPHDLDRNFALRRRVFLRLVHLAHTADVDGPHDPIGAYLVALGERARSAHQQPGSGPQLDSPARGVRQKGLDLSPHGVVRAGLNEKSGSFTRLLIECGIEQLLDPPPVLRSHRSTSLIRTAAVSVAAVPSGAMPGPLSNGASRWPRTGPSPARSPQGRSRQTTAAPRLEQDGGQTIPGGSRRRPRLGPRRDPQPPPSNPG